MALNVGIEPNIILADLDQALASSNTAGTDSLYSESTGDITAACSGYPGISVQAARWRLSNHSGAGR